MWLEVELAAAEEERLSVVADVFDRINIDPCEIAKCTRRMDDAH